MDDPSIPEISAAEFAAVVNSRFEVVVAGGGKVGLILISMSAPRTTSTGPKQFESFSLVFEGKTEQPLGQALYRFEHESLGATDIFIVPIGMEAGRRQYEAVFNRVIGE